MILQSWVDKFRTGSGSDRVTSGVQSTSISRIDPVATTPGSVFVRRDIPLCLATLT